MDYDIVNAAFETLGACLTALSVRRLYIDKRVRGVSIWPILFFFGWGVWNLFYYPSLGQYYSFYASIGLVLINGVWIAQMVYYGYKEKGGASDRARMVEASKMD